MLLADPRVVRASHLVVGEGVPARLAGGSISGTHDADITGGTIQQALAERLDLHSAAWVALQDGRDPENEKYLHQRHEAALAA